MNRIPKHPLTLLLACLLSLATGLAQAALRMQLEPAQKLLFSDQPQTTYLRISLEGVFEADEAERAPVNVALVLDRSGSMQGDKLRHAREAALLALDYLRPRDILSLVTYDDTVEVPITATRFHDRAAVERAIRRIRAGGNTALFAGTAKGASEVAKFKDDNHVNRVILLSDGLANVGPSSPGELQRLGRKLGGQGMSVTTIGLGLGYNEDLMVRLAQASDGNHVFAEQPEELASIFRNEFGELGRIVAQDLVITIRCPEGVRPLRMVGREADIDRNRIVTRINQLAAEQEKYLLLEVEVRGDTGASERELADVELTYLDMVKGERQRRSDQARVEFTPSETKAQKSVQPEVMVSVTQQLATEMDDQALALKDQGRDGEAAKVFKQKADFLEEKAEAYDSDELRAQGAFSRELEDSVSAPAAVWNKARKEAREEQFIIRNQQSYK